MYFLCSNAKLVMQVSVNNNYKIHMIGMSTTTCCILISVYPILIVHYDYDPIIHIERLTIYFIFLMVSHAHDDITGIF